MHTGPTAQPGELSFGQLPRGDDATLAHLATGIKLQGQIESFDQFVILLKNTVSQMVYKHAISTVVPSRPVRLPSVSEAELAEAEPGNA